MKTIPTLSRIHLLSDDEKLICQMAIRAAGTGDHPYPDDETIGGFAIAFVVECLEKVKFKNPETRAAGQQLLAALRDELENG